MEKNKENKKSFLADPNAKILLSGILLIIILIAGWIALNYTDTSGNSKDKKYTHNASAIVKEEKYKDLKFSNIKMVTENGYTTVSADVTNIGTAVNTIEDVNVDLLDKNGNVVITLIWNIGKDLQPKATRQLTASALGEFKNVTSKKIG